MEFACYCTEPIDVSRLGSAYVVDKENVVQGEYEEGRWFHISNSPRSACSEAVLDALKSSPGAVGLYRAYFTREYVMDYVRSRERIRVTGLPIYERSNLPKNAAKKN